MSPRAAIVAALALAHAACVSERERSDPRPTTFWIGTIDQLVAATCVDCHGGPSPAGSYDLSSYLGALGGGSDAMPNAIAGDARSRLLAVLDEDDPVHATVAAVRPELERWVVDARLAYQDSDLHEPGLMNPADDEFHGTMLAHRGWDFSTCARCHGDDFAGGVSGKSCLGCHDDGPTACTTCHGDGPTTGAHAAHRGGALDRPAGCGDCHRMPEAWDSPGHILREGREGEADPLPAEVVLGAAAARDVEPPRRTEPPHYDPATGTCSAVYCHGGTLHDEAAEFPAPRWTSDGDQAACGGCHGVPPADHGASQCRTCHPSTIDDSGGLVTARHLDGVLDVGDGTLGCTACHGSEGSPAPPRDLDGGTRVDLVTVGAHRAHLDAPSRLSSPIRCAECHLVPSAIGSPGHIDDDRPAEVFPAGSGTLARADDAAPVWTRATARCADTYCHGGGASLALDAAPGRNVAPVWTRVGLAEAACGRCHGLPPQTPTHPAATLSECAGCHPSVDGTGNILFTDGTNTRHLDGNVDLDP